MTAPILVVDDELAFVESVTSSLRARGHREVVGCTQPREVEALLATRAFAVALLDVRMAELDGLSLLERIRERSPTTACIMVSGSGSVATVVSAIKLGAYDYLAKPLDPDALFCAIDRALEVTHLRRFVSRRQGARAGLESACATDFITTDPILMDLLDEAELHAASDIPVLVTGETGVGKELLARAVHRFSRRAEGPFVAVNMMAVSGALFESTFFGHARGAFTGAVRDHAGYLAQATGGTLFLDEIGDLSHELQGKLLRVLQENEFIPVGKTRAVHADVRFIAATNADLEAEMRAGRFRADLFFRLRFAQLSIPPLRERRDDVLLLAHAFLRARLGPNANVSSAAARRLLAYDYPGNVRELRGVIESAANRAAGASTIDEQHLSLPRQQKDALPIGAAVEPLAEVERRHILSVYECCGRNKTHTAAALGIAAATLHRKLKAYGVP